MDPFKTGFHKGQMFMYSDDHAVGALKNGSEVEKMASEPGDSFPDGTTGVVIGSLDGSEVDVANDPFFYFVRFGGEGPVVGISGARLRPMDRNQVI